ncbi:MAG: hypothetical protein JWQ66_4695, partial [Mucilaginibacter sp.]|nr:hypothetical protein [Mucilaginibacter sp.]
MPDPNSKHAPITDLKQTEVIKRYEILDTPRLAIEAANVGTWILDQS